MEQPVSVCSFIASEPEVKPPTSVGMDFFCQFSGGMKPARQIISRAPHRTVGSIHAPWFQADPVHHESDLEAAVVRVLLVTPPVVSIQHQPARIQYFDGTQARQHIPDFLLTLNGKRQVMLEVKPERLIEKHRAKFDACASVLGEVDYVVVTDQHVNKVRGSRAAELLHMARLAANAEELADLLNCVARQKRVFVREALARGHSRLLLMHAVGRRLVFTSPSLQLAPEDWLLSKDSVDDFPDLKHWLGCSVWLPERRRG